MGFNRFSQDSRGVDARTVTMLEDSFSVVGWFEKLGVVFSYRGYR